MNVAKPPITWVGTKGNNIWAGAGLPRKLAIVCHIMEGTLAGCDSWFQSPQAQASANFGIGKDGTIHMYVDPEGNDAPFANGLINRPDATVTALLAEMPGVNPNWYTVSIEHEGFSGTPLTPAQLAASAQLTAWLCERFSIPPDEDHLTGHYEWDSVTRAGCPGWDRAGWVRYEQAVAAVLSQGPTPPADPCAGKDAQIAAITAERDTLRAKVAAAQAALA